MNAQFCPSCMSTKYSGGYCGQCGFRLNEYKPAPTALPLGAEVGVYRIGVMKTSSRQSQIYTGVHSGTSAGVIIEEFFPQKVVGRQPGNPMVLVVSNDPEKEKRFQQGCVQMEATEQKRPLKRIATVRANNTVYSIFEPQNNVSVAAQCEALADYPVYFRDANGKPRMSINLLDIPPMPQERVFNPGEIDFKTLVTETEEISKEEFRTTIESNSKKFQPKGTRILGMVLGGVAAMAIAFCGVSRVTMGRWIWEKGTEVVSTTEEPSTSQDGMETEISTDDSDHVDSDIIGSVLSLTEEPSSTPEATSTLTVEPISTLNMESITGASASPSASVGSSAKETTLTLAPLLSVTPTSTMTMEPTSFVASEESSTLNPTNTPTVEPTVTPTMEPTVTPTEELTATPTAEPTETPTPEPTETPPPEPTATPTAEPTKAVLSDGEQELYYKARIEWKENTNSALNAIVPINYQARAVVRNRSGVEVGLIDFPQTKSISAVRGITSKSDWWKEVKPDNSQYIGYYATFNAIDLIINKLEKKTNITYYVEIDILNEAGQVIDQTEKTPTFMIIKTDNSKYKVEVVDDEIITEAPVTNQDDTKSNIADDFDNRQGDSVGSSTLDSIRDPFVKDKVYIDADGYLNCDIKIATTRDVNSISLRFCIVEDGKEPNEQKTFTLSPDENSAKYKVSNGNGKFSWNFSLSDESLDKLQGDSWMIMIQYEVGNNMYEETVGPITRNKGVMNVGNK